MRIMVSGMLGGVPRQGGATWAVLQYVLGLRRLGHDVTVVEPVARIEEPSVAYFEDVARSFGLTDCAALVDPHGNTAGIGRRRLTDGCDVLLNISGMLQDDDLLAGAGLRVFIDLDPGFTQLWCAVDGIDPGFDRHDRFVTIGQAIGRPGCEVPTCGRTWISIAQPVVLEHWPLAGDVTHHAATTIGHWRAYGSIVHGGVRYGQKAHSMRALLPLTGATQTPFLLALGIHPDERDDLDALRRHRWPLVDPDCVAGTPAAYQAFVQGSWAELGIAKEGYVASRCGWFSDRSVCYLASGRPVVAQDTGFSDWLPTGEGLIAFSTVGDAAAALEEVCGDYERHRRAARALAVDVFDSDRVLGRLLACL